jgi:hypothetical protein
MSHECHRKNAHESNCGTLIANMTAVEEQKASVGEANKNTWQFYTVIYKNCSIGERKSVLCRVIAGRNIFTCVQHQTMI